MHRKELHIALGLFAVMTLVFACAARAQQGSAEQAGAPDLSIEDIIDQQFEQVITNIAELKRLQSMFPRIKPELRELLQRRVDDKKSQVLNSVNSLAEESLLAENREIVTELQRKQIISWLRVHPPWLTDKFTRNNEKILGGIGDLSRLTVPEAGSMAIEVIARTSENASGYAVYYRTLKNLESFEEDVSDSRQDLVNRVHEGTEMLAVAIEIDTEELQKLRYRLSLTPDDAELHTMTEIVDFRRKGYARALLTMSDILDELGIDPSEYRGMVLVVTGDVSSQILDAGVMATLAKQWSKAALEWTNQNGLGLTIKLVIFILIILAFRALSKLTRRWVERGIKRLNLSVLLRGMIVSSAANLVLAIGVLIALSQMGVSLGPLLAGIGVLGFIVGFALQDTLGNFASGMMILTYRPYDVGDIITAAGVTGKVKDMTLVYTIINTFDNQMMVVPNSKIWGDVIQNVTSQRIRRVDMVFGISYSDDIAKAEKVLGEIISDHEMTLDEPEAMIKVHTLNESSVDFIVRPWVKSGDYWDVYWDITREVKIRFDQEGISIPFPQRDVHHYHDEAPPTKS